MPQDAAPRLRANNPGVLRLVPLYGELVRSAEDQAPLVERNGLRRFEPSAYDRVGQFPSRLIEEALPSFFG